jgi:7-cyano-7-deazaguanine synthase
MKPGQGRNAVVLLSGGLDSAVALACASGEGFDCHALSFDYGQRHRVELSSARKVAKQLGAKSHRVLKIDLRAIGGSALTDKIAVPKGRSIGQMASEIPVTYVPARNTIFLSCALGLAEVLKARDIYIGVNFIDYSGYPDCRPEFIREFEALAALATKAGVEGARLRVRTPLIAMGKGEIVRLGAKLGVNFKLTHSCYDPVRGKACGRCDSCLLRRQGFLDARIKDPTVYANA